MIAPKLTLLPTSANDMNILLPLMNRIEPDRRTAVGPLTKSQDEREAIQEKRLEVVHAQLSFVCASAWPLGPWGPEAWMALLFPWSWPRGPTDR